LKAPSYHSDPSEGISFCKWHECQDCVPRAESIEELRSARLQDLRIDASMMSYLRQVLALQGSAMSLSQADDDEVLRQVALLLEQKVLRRCSPSRRGSVPKIVGRAQSASEKVLRILGGHAEHFNLEGRALRLIRAEDWRRLSGDDRYQIVPAPEAKQLIAKLTATTARPAFEIEAWQKAAELLQEQRGVRYSSGLLLLRIRPQRNLESPPGEAPVTPSQLAKIVKTHWVAIEVVDDDGQPVAEVNYSIVTPDNQTYTGSTDAFGYARIDNIPAGQCKVSFPDLDKSAIKAG
jgi:hypothetical protein